MERTFKATVEEVFAKLTDPAWLEARSKAMGERSAKVRVKTGVRKGLPWVRVVMKRHIHRELPPLVAAVMPSEADVCFTEMWTSDGQGGWDGDLLIEVPGQPVHMSAEFTLAPSGKGCEFAIEHEAQCALPFIGSTVAAVAHELLAQGCAGELDYLAQSLKRPATKRAAPAKKARTP